MARALDLSGWTPVRLHGCGAGMEVEWVYTGELRFTDPFFEETVQIALRDPFALLFRRRTSIEALGGWSAVSPGLTPNGLVFHLSRCGSTLVTQLLARSPRFLVLSEPGPVDAILRAAALRSERVQWLRWIVSALGQRRHGETHLVLKLDSWSILHLDLVEEAFPQAPWIFLFRAPADVLASQVRHTGAHGIPGVLPPGLFGLSLKEAQSLTREEYIGRVLARICEAALEQAGNPRGLFVDYAELPTFVFNRLPEHFGFTLSSAERQRMREEATHDAKNPAIAFAPHRGHVSPAVQEVATRLLDPLYERLREC